MEENVNMKQDKDDIRYWRIDRFLLYLLAGELGYFILLIIAGLVFMILTWSTDINLLTVNPNTIIWLILIYVVALPVNLYGAFSSLVFTIRTKQKGYPGTGNLLNWIYILNTSWMFIFIILVLIPGIAGGD
jgi:hypothetical protein